MNTSQSVVAGVGIVDPWTTAALGAALALGIALGLVTVLKARPATSRAVLLAATGVALLAPALVAMGRSLSMGILEPEPSETRVAAPAASRPAVVAAREESAAEPVARDVPPAATTAAAPSAVPAQGSAGIDPRDVAWAVWVAGVLLGLAGILRGALAARRLRRGCAPASDPRVTDAASLAAERLALRALPVFVGAAVPSPVTVGWLRPAVLLPSELARTLADDELRAVLLHEAAHVAARDPLAALLSRVVRALHWFDPLAHAATRRLLDVHERLADASAVSTRAVTTERYAACLARVAEAALLARAPAALSGMAGRRGTLSRRVEALFAPSGAEAPRLRAGGRVLAATVALVASGVLLVAHDRRAGAADDEQPAVRSGGLTYTGRILDASGSPLAGATVWVIHGPPPQVMMSPSLLPWRPLALSPPLRPVGGSSMEKAARATGDDGRFSVAGIEPPAGGFVVVVHSGHVPARVAADPRRLSGGLLDAGEIRLEKGGTLRARVLDAKGAPVEGAWVAVQPGEFDWERYSPGEIRSAKTNADGLAVVEGLRDAPYVGGAFTDTAPPVEHPFRVASGAVHEADFRLSEGRTFRVLVVDRATGAPLSGARVDVDPKPPADDYRISLGAPVLASSRTDAQGVAEFPGLSDGEFEATAVPPDHVKDGIHHPPPFSVTRTGRPGTDLVLRLQAAAPFAIAAIDAETKEPVTGLCVHVRPDWPGYDREGGTPVDVRIESDEKRPYHEVHGLRPGPWFVSVFSQDHLPRRGQRLVVGPETPVWTVELVPARGAAHGRVVASRDGSAVANAKIFAYEWVQVLGDGQRLNVETDADGRFRLSPCLGAGFPLRLEIKAPGYLPRVWMQEEDARTSDLGPIVLLRGGTVRGLLADERGRPMPDMEVLLLPHDVDRRSKGDGRTATTDAGGRFAFVDVPPGPAALLAPGVDRTPVQVTETGEIEVRLRASRPGR